MAPPIDSFSGEYRYLSNFAGPAQGCEKGVELDGKLYPTSEHAYQAAKFAHIPKIAAWIRQQSSPSKAKYEAAKFKVNVRPDWRAVNLDIMKRILRSKFERNPNLAAKLCGTGDAELIEGNNWGDDFFGQVNGVGANHLGKMLMELRSQLRGVPSPTPVTLMDDYLADQIDTFMLAPDLFKHLQRLIKEASASNQRLERDEVRDYLDEATMVLEKLEALYK